MQQRYKALIGTGMGLEIEPPMKLAPAIYYQPRQSSVEEGQLDHALLPRLHAEILLL